MGLFRNLFRVTKSRNRDLSRPTEEPCLCSGCGNALPSIMSEIVDAETISCPMCTKKHKLLDERYPEYDEFEVLVYALPWNPAIQAYAYRGQQWLPTYQADTRRSTLERFVRRDEIPQTPIFATITLAISEHGSFTYYNGRPALIALLKQANLLCAYVPRQTV